MKKEPWDGQTLRCAHYTRSFSRVHGPVESSPLECGWVLRPASHQQSNSRDLESGGHIRTNRRDLVGWEQFESRESKMDHMWFLRGGWECEPRPSWGTTPPGSAPTPVGTPGEASLLPRQPLSGLGQWAGAGSGEGRVPHSVAELGLCPRSWADLLQAGLRLNKGPVCFPRRGLGWGLPVAWFRQEPF